MRIATISPYALSLPGGVQDQVIGLSREFARAGHEVMVIAPDAHDQQSYRTTARIERFGRLVSLPANGSRAPITLSPLASWRVATAIEDFSAEVVHLHEPFAPLAGYATLHRHRVPTLATVHRSGWGPAYFLTRPLLTAMSSRLDDVVAVSESAASTFQRATGRSCDVAWNGIDINAGPEIDDREDLVVVIGRLEQRKGISVALDAFVIFQQSHPTFRLIVVGDGPLRADIEARARTMTGVELRGRVSDEERDDWLHRAKVVLCPALGGESFGIVVAEAMAAGAAVIASDIDGYRQVVGDGAALASPGEAAQWARKLSEVAADARHVSQRGRERAATFSLEALATFYLERFDRLISTWPKR